MSNEQAEAQPEERPLISGAEALGRGALAAGCAYFASSGSLSGPSAWLERLASHPAADEDAALSLSAGAAWAGARSLADLCAGGLAPAAEALRCCVEAGIPVVAMAPDDGWRWPELWSVAELRPRTAAEAFLAVGQAFDLAEAKHAPVVVRVDRGLLALREALPEQPGAPAPVERRPPGRRPLEERESLPAEAFVPAGLADGACAGLAALRALSQAWSGQGLSALEILVVSGSGCCQEEPVFPKTRCLRVPAGRALAFAMGAKAAAPALCVVALDDGEAVFSRSLPRLLQAARLNCDLAAVVWRRGPACGADLLDLAQRAGASFVARLSARDEAARAEVAARAIAHKGFSVLELACGQAAPGEEPAPAGVLCETTGRPTWEESRPVIYP